MNSLLYIWRARHCLSGNLRPVYQGGSKKCCTVGTQLARYSRFSTPGSRTTRAVRTRRPYVKNESSTARSNKSRSEKSKLIADDRLKYIQNWSDQGKALYRDIVSERVQSARQVQTCISEGDLTLETIHVCLSAEQWRLFKLKREQRIEKLRNWDGPLARLILVHIWEDINMWHPLITKDKQASFMLCLLAVNEGLDQYIIDWLKTVNPSLDASQSQQLAWRNALFRNLVAAHMNINAKACADDAINCFWTVARAASAKASELQTTKKGDGIQYLSLKPALQYMAIELLTGRYGNTDAGLYQRIWRMYKSYVGRGQGTIADRPSQAFCLAGADLFHPRDPSGDKAIAFLQSHAEAVPLKNFRDLLPLKARNLQTYIMRVIELAQRDGRQEDVKWMRDLLKDLGLSQIKYSPPAHAIDSANATESRPIFKKYAAKTT